MRAGIIFAGALLFNNINIGNNSLKHSLKGVLVEDILNVPNITEVKKYIKDRDTKHLISLSRLYGLDSFRGTYNRTLLMEYAEKGDYHNCVYLIKFGAGINTRDSFGRSAMDYSIFSRNQQLINYLISKGADPTHINDLGWAPIHRMVEYNLRESVKYTLKNYRGVLDIYDNLLGFTPLHYAAAYADLEMVKILVESGKFDVRAKAKDGRLPHQIAKSKEVREYLRHAETVEN